MELETPCLYKLKDYTSVSNSFNLVAKRVSSLYKIKLGYLYKYVMILQIFKKKIFLIT